MDLITNFKKYSSYDKLGIFLFILAIISLLFPLLSINTSIWGDEAFSLLAIKFSFSDMFTLLNFDVHPFLYYILLKIFIDVMSLFNFNVIIMGKLFSVFPFIFLLLLAGLRIRKCCGWLCAGLFSFCIMFMPQMMHYAIEIRMYSWAMFFVTLSFWYAYEITLNPSTKNWFLFILASTLASYTHYYATLDVGIIYLILGYHLFRTKCELNKYVVSILITGLLFLGNLKLLMRQVLSVKHSYWISKLTIDTIIKDILYIISPHNYHLFEADLKAIITSYNLDILGVILVLLYFILALIYFKNKEDNGILINGSLILIISSIFGILVSILIKPVFVARYMIPSLACFWLTFAFLLSKTNKKLILIFTLIILFFVAGGTTISFILTEQTEYFNNIELNNFVSRVNSNESIILKDNGLNCNVVNYYFHENYNVMNSSEKIGIWLKNKKNIWLFGNDDEYLKDNYTLEKKYDFSQDFIDIPVYQIKNNSSIN